MSIHDGRPCLGMSFSCWASVLSMIPALHLLQEARPVTAKTAHGKIHQSVDRLGE